MKDKESIFWTTDVDSVFSQQDYPSRNAILQKIHSSTSISNKKIRFISLYYNDICEAEPIDEYTWEIRMYLLNDSSPENSKRSYDFFEHTAQDEEKLVLAGEVFFAEPRKPVLVEQLTEKNIFPDDDWEPQIPEERVLVALMKKISDMRMFLETKFLHENIENFSLSSMGGACPFQAEGRIHGYCFYFRYRGGTASLRIGDDDFFISRPHWEAYMDYGDDLSGSLTNREFMYLFSVLLTRLEKAKINFTFSIKPEANYGYYEEKTRAEAARLFAEKTRQYAILTQIRTRSQEEVDQWIRVADESGELRTLSMHAYSHDEARELLMEQCSLQAQDLVLLEDDKRIFPEQKPDFVPKKIFNDSSLSKSSVSQ